MVPSPNTDSQSISKPVHAFMEQLIRELNAPSNQGAPHRIDQIQKEIQRLQRESSGWQLGLNLLDHDEELMRFYGALTLTIKVNADWSKDVAQGDRIAVNQLIESLVSTYVRLWEKPDAEFVLAKLSGTLSSVFEKQDSAWALPCRHVLACIIAGHYVPQDKVPEMGFMLESEGELSGNKLKAVLRLALSITEDLGQTSATTRGQHVHVRLSNNAADVWCLIHYCVSNFTKDAGMETNGVNHYSLILKTDQNQLLAIVRTAVQLIPYWTSYVTPESSTLSPTAKRSIFPLFRESVDKLLRMFDLNSEIESILHMISTVESDHHRILQKAVPDYCERVTDSNAAASWIATLTAGDFDSGASFYADFLDAVISQIDPTSPEYLQNQRYVTVLQQAQKLLRCEGVALVEDNVCRVALEIMSTIAEGFSDWPGPSQYDESLRELLYETCSATLLKIRLPATELDARTQTWDEDERIMFEDFRFDVQDFLITAFSTLGVGLVEQIVQPMVQLNAASDWNAFEAGLFALVALSDAVATDPTKYDPFIVIVLESNMWKYCTLSEANVPSRVGQTVIKFLGENTSFLQRQPHFLVHSLDFLFGSLHLRMVSGPASRAIHTLCDSQRTFLVEALPQFLTSLTTIGDLSGNSRYRIFGAVSAIVQALPHEADKPEPLRQILSLLQAELNDFLEVNDDCVEVIGKSTEIIQTLAAIGKGLRSPSDNAVDLEETVASEELFWTQGPGLFVQQSALNILAGAFACYDHTKDFELVAASCDFLKAGFTETHPSPFKFPPQVSVELLGRLLDLDNPNLDQTMSTASSYLSSMSPSEENNGFETLLGQVVEMCQSATPSFSNVHDGVLKDSPASALDFLARLLPKWGVTWFALDNALQSASIIVDFALALLKDADTLPRRVAAAFFASLFEASSPGSKLMSNDTTSLKVTNLLDYYAPRIVGLIMYLLGGECARSEIETITEPLRRFLGKHQLRAKPIIRQALQSDSGVLSVPALGATKPEQRARFAAQLDTLRGSRKTYEITKEFWISCRGSNFGYIT